MFSAYREFFAASTGASAAFTGLLFVGLSFIDAAKVSESTRAWRRIIANSSFSQLVNIFFVSLAGLLPDAHNAALVGCVMAVLGLTVSIRLLPQAIEQERTGRRWPSTLGLVTVAAYGLQLASGIGLLLNPNSPTWLGYFAFALVLLYGGALARAWEITGIKLR